MQLRNRVLLIGNLGANPVVKELENGTNMAKCAIATHEYYMKDGNRVEDTQWHNLVAFGRTAEIVARYLKKGSEVAVEGKLTHRRYENSEGKTRFFTEVQITDLLMLGRPDKDKVEAEA